MISRKKAISFTIVISMIILLATMSVIAETLTETKGPTSSWSYSDYSHGTYVPKTGYLATRFFDYSQSRDQAKTYVKILLDQNNVDKILDYNDGNDNPGTAIDNCTAYLTCDVRSKSGTYDMMSAYSVTSSLPNPKCEVENDDTLGTRNEEAEVVALGSVEAAEYNMITLWEDYRNDNTAGRWDCQFSMSGHYLKVFGAWIASYGDYNTMIMSDITQASVSYGKSSGKP